jgi:hydrogenase-4 membrane subunit HyfE
MKQPTSKPESEYKVDTTAIVAALFLLFLFAFVVDIVRICLWGWNYSPDIYHHTNTVVWSFLGTVIFGLFLFISPKHLNRK